MKRKRIDICLPNPSAVTYIIASLALLLTFNSIAQEKKERPKYGKTGIYTTARFGAGPEDETGQIQFAFGGQAGIQLFRFFSVGGGVEYNTLDEGSFGTIYNLDLLPVYLDARLSLPSRRKFHPCVLINYGTSFIIDKSQKIMIWPNDEYFIPTEGGEYLGIGAGFKIYVKERAAVGVDGGYYTQSIVGRYESDYETQRKTLEGPRFNISLNYVIVPF